MISRDTRSASVSIVSIMNRFCSSVNFSHPRSRVAEKPLTEVNGERSSWAIVEISAAWSCSARWRADASRTDISTRRTGPLSGLRR